MLRNPDAVKRMKEYGVTNEIHCTADGAYEYPTPPEEYINEIIYKILMQDKK